MGTLKPSNSHLLPTTIHPSSSHNTTSHSPQKSWLQGLASSKLNREPTSEKMGNQRTPKWWKIRLFRGMVNDVRRRLPYYWSDWTDAWDYRVIPATVYMYFANILPALAFSLDMFTKTHMSYGVNEVLLASVLGSVVFSIFAAQPLVIVGVTGPITVFNYTVYDIMTPTGTNYFAFMALIGLWSLLMHWLLAITNACNALKYVTRFSCDIFGFYVAFIYLQKGIQVLTRQGSDSAFYLSLTVALLVLAVGYLCGLIGTSSLFQHYVRVFIKDYGTPLTVIFFTGFVHIGRMREVELSTLPTSRAFFPTSERGWFVHFWDIRLGDVFIAIPFAVLLTILFYFDHNVSSLIAQGTEFPLRKPAGFHWDLFLLGLTTLIAGLLGIPFPNGLIPQAPFHTESLCVSKLVPITPSSTSDLQLDSTTSPSSKITTTPSSSPPSPPNSKNNPQRRYKTLTTHVVEQRLSNLAQGLLTLITMTRPFLFLLHLIPQSVLSGLFFVMGLQALSGNGITLRLLYLLHDPSLPLPLDQNPALASVSRSKVFLFTAIQILAFAATFAITQTVAAVAFPLVIIAMVPLRVWVLPKWFGESELNVLDAPVVGEFTLRSVVGEEGGEGESNDSTTVAAAERGEGIGTKAKDGNGGDGSGGESFEMNTSASASASASEQQLGMSRRRGV